MSSTGYTPTIATSSRPRQLNPTTNNANSSNVNNHHQTLTIPQLLHPSPHPITATASGQAIPPQHQQRQQEQPVPPAPTTPHDIVFSPDNIQLLDEYGQHPRFLELQQELRCLLFTGARSRRGSIGAGDEGGLGYRDEEEVRGGPVGDGRRREEEEGSPQLMKKIITSGKMAGYLKNYMAQVAPWLDMFDTSLHFTIHIPILARHSAPLLYALLAVSARQIERRNTQASPNTTTSTSAYDSLSLYQSSISLLKPVLEAHDPNVLASCVILCVLEMMSVSSVGNPGDWRRHLEGCAALFEAFGVHGFSGGLLGAVFWCYARMDLCLAMISDGADTLVLPISKWIPPDTSEDQAAEMFRSANNPDMYANYSVYISAKVCDLLCARTRFVEMQESNHEFGGGEKFVQRWNELWKECRLWDINRPREIMPIEMLHPPSDGGAENPFPEIFFGHWAAISSTQLHHTSCIILLDIKPPTANPDLRTSTATAASTSTSDLDRTSSVHWHARQICGISMTNAHEGCLNNSIQPLWIAGKLLSHRTEHTLLVGLIRRIERTTGWGTSWRIRDLREAWGYD